MENKLDVKDSESHSQQHEALCKAVISHFVPKFMPDAVLVYSTLSIDSPDLDKDLQTKLCIPTDNPQALPDIILYKSDSNWLVLIDLVTGHRVMGNNRCKELIRMFKDSPIEQVFVNAFHNKKEMTDSQTDIAWGTNVWFSEEPEHMIHFDGNHVVEPYKK